MYVSFAHCVMSVCYAICKLRVFVCLFLDICLYFIVFMWRVHCLLRKVRFKRDAFVFRLVFGVFNYPHMSALWFRLTAMRDYEICSTLRKVRWF